MPLGVLDLDVVEEADGGAPPEDVVSVVLGRVSISASFFFLFMRYESRSLGTESPRTSFFVTGLSDSTRCVSRGKPPSTSRSASSATWFDASTRWRRFGIEAGRVPWMAEMRLRASSSVVTRGERGKLPSTAMSLSVRSNESWGCRCVSSARVGGMRHGCEGVTYAGNAQVLNGGDSVACTRRAPQGGLLSTLPWQDVGCSICSFP